MAGPYTDVTTQAGATVLGLLGGYSKTNPIAVTNVNTQVDAEENNRIRGAIGDICNWVQTYQPLITGAADRITATASPYLMATTNTGAQNRVALLAAVAAGKAAKKPCGQLRELPEYPILGAKKRPRPLKAC